MKICIVIANYYPKISKDLLSGASKVLKNNGLKSQKIIFTPGIFEIPVVISKNIDKYDAFVALGCVIKGETPHFDFISGATINALINLSITHKVPIGNGIVICLFTILCNLLTYSEEYFVPHLTHITLSFILYLLP